MNKIINGKREGYWMEKYLNGNKWYECYYIHGSRFGVCTTYEVYSKNELHIR